MRAATLDEADAALAQWRERLAAASRNVVELSELPAYLALKARPQAGRTGEAAAALVATMDELWQGVLLIGAAIDRAAAARSSGSRLWRGEEAAAETLDILHGETIEVAMGDLPVLNRGLLGTARHAVKVTPQRMLEAMEQAFERAKASIESLAQARERCAAAQAELLAMLGKLASANWAGAAEARARAEAIAADADPVGALEAFAALRGPVAAALQQVEAAEQALAAARADLDALAALRQRTEAAAAECRAATDFSPALPEAGEAMELAGWLDRLARTLQGGQIDGFRVGLSRWRELAAKVRRENERALAAAGAVLARRDELRGRYGALRAKQAARDAKLPAPDRMPAETAKALHAALFGGPARLAEAERLMAAFEAALARPAAGGGSR